MKKTTYIYPNGEPAPSPHPISKGMQNLQHNDGMQMHIVNVDDD